MFANACRELAFASEVGSKHAVAESDILAVAGLLRHTIEHGALARVLGLRRTAALPSLILFPLLELQSSFPFDGATTAHRLKRLAKGCEAAAKINDNQWKAVTS